MLRFLGLLCLTAGEIDKAIAHFEDARNTCRRHGFTPLLGWSCYDFARALLQRGHLQDKARAAELAAEALSLAASLV